MNFTFFPLFSDGEHWTLVNSQSLHVTEIKKKKKKEKPQKIVRWKYGGRVGEKGENRANKNNHHHLVFHNNNARSGLLLIAAAVRIFTICLHLYEWVCSSSAPIFTSKYHFSGRRYTADFIIMIIIIIAATIWCVFVCALRITVFGLLCNICCD